VAEAAALEAARVELGAGRASAALAALDGYDQRFPHGELQPEATALRVEALMASGNSSAARSLGADFLAKHPRHPAAARVRRIVDEPRP
jgi:outer membrane protein assembly factor BamD (BamD/ComL family)